MATSIVPADRDQGSDLRVRQARQARRRRRRRSRTATRWCSPPASAPTPARGSTSSRSRSTSRSGCTPRGRSPAASSAARAVPSETAILTARLIDRPLRPTFREGYRDEVQVVVTVLSVDMANPYDIPAMNAASLATVHRRPAVRRPGRRRPPRPDRRRWVVNPTFQELEEATFDIVVAGRRTTQGEIDILMIEGEAPDETWPLLAAGGVHRADRGGRRPGPRGAKRAIAEVIDSSRSSCGRRREAFGL